MCNFYLLLAIVVINGKKTSKIDNKTQPSLCLQTWLQQNLRISTNRKYRIYMNVFLQPDVLKTWHFVNLTFCKPDVLQTWRFVNLTFQTFWNRTFWNLTFCGCTVSRPFHAIVGRIMLQLTWFYVIVSHSRSLLNSLRSSCPLSRQKLTSQRGSWPLCAVVDLCAQ